MIAVKRVYEAPSHEDGVRVLVERLWPRGLSKQKAKVDLWIKDVAPSPELRKWFHHDAAKWKKFQSAYTKELRSQQNAVDFLRELSKKRKVTFVYAARDEAHNGAIVLRRLLSNRKRPAGE